MVRVSADRCFGFSCRQFATSLSKSEDNWKTIGFNNWRHFLDKKGVAKHENSIEHKTTMSKWETHEAIQLGKATRIDTTLEPERKTILDENREYFKLLLKFHIRFVCEPIPYTGHDETSGSLSIGKWKAFLTLMKAANPTFKDRQTKFRSLSRSDYTSEWANHELLTHMAETVKQNIVEEVKMAKMFSIVIDEGTAIQLDIINCQSFLDT